MIQLKSILNEDLRNWFGKGKTGSTTGGGWDRYDRDSDSFWMDNITGNGQKSFETTAELLTYIKKNKTAYLKARKNYTSKGYTR